LKGDTEGSCGLLDFSHVETRDTLAAFQRTATREMRGTACLRSSSC
jgi:hypothetical protein